MQGRDRKRGELQKREALQGLETTLVALKCGRFLKGIKRKLKTVAGSVAAKPKNKAEKKRNLKPGAKLKPSAKMNPSAIAIT